MSDFLDNLEAAQPTSRVKSSVLAANTHQEPLLSHHDPAAVFELESSLQSFPEETRSFNVSSYNSPGLDDTVISGNIAVENVANNLWQEHTNPLATNIPLQQSATFTSCPHMGMHGNSSPLQLDSTQSTQASLSSLQQIGFVPLYMVVGSGLGVVGVPPVYVNIHDSQNTGTENLYFIPRSIEGSSAVFPDQLASVPLDAGWNMPRSSHEDRNSWNTNDFASSTADGSGSDNINFPHGVLSDQAPFLCICGGLPRTNPMIGPLSNHQTNDAFINSGSQSNTSQQYPALLTAGTTSPWTANNLWPVPEVTNYTSPYAESNAIGTSTSSSSTMTTDYTQTSGSSWQH
ncbi:hypothetical protein MMC17_000968 [Xylographa soralifera]|nr:hypothetical protein [Xylographa soralifera]